MIGVHRKGQPQYRMLTPPCQNQILQQDSRNYSTGSTQIRMASCPRMSFAMACSKKGINLHFYFCVCCTAAVDLDFKKELKPAFRNDYSSDAYRYEIQDIQQRLPALFASMDKDGDGEISKDEFVAHFDAHEKLLSPIYKRGALVTAVNMGRLFERLDVDKNGCLSRNELREGLMQEGYDDEEIQRRLPLLFNSMDKDADGDITKEEFVAHFDANKGFSPIPSSRTRSGMTPMAGTPKSEQRTKAETRDIVDMVLDDIQETATAREREQASSDSAQSPRVSARSASSRAGQGMQSDEPSVEKDSAASDERQFDESVVGQLDDEPMQGQVAVIRQLSSSHSASRSQRRASTASSAVTSSIGSEQARDELKALGTSVVDMMDDIFADVVEEFSPNEVEASAQRHGADLPIPLQPSGALRPLSAPGVRRKPARLEALAPSVRPQTAGAVRGYSTSEAVLLSGSDEEELVGGRTTSIPRLSMTAVGRARRMRDGINAQDEAGNTSLHLAVKEQDLDAVKSLLEAGANANIANKMGLAPIHLAAKAGNARIVKLLAPAVTNINQAGPDGFTALHCAIESADLGLVQSLCETFGADISSQTNHRETPAQLASRLLGSDAPVSRYLASTMETLPAL